MTISQNDQLGGLDVIKIKEQGTWGNCGCGGKIVYFSDFGVRCEKCHKLYGTWVENLRKAKQEEHRKKEHIAQLIQLKKFDDEMAI
jgi:glycyl-tRNA synthetase (class II)